MPSAFHGLNTSYTGLIAHQAALNTVGHNIANVNTEGYTRQRVSLVESYPYTMPGMNNAVSPGQLGSGVSVQDIKQVRDQFLDQQFRAEQPKLGAWTARKYALDKIENIINEPSDNGITVALNDFWKSLQELGNDPGSSTTRAQVAQKANALCDMITSVSDQLNDLRSDLDDLIGTGAKNTVTGGQNRQTDGVTGQINSLVKDIADLNKQIKQVETDPNQNANDWRDQRNLKIDQLSNLIDIRVNEQFDGTVEITLGGQQLVSGQDYKEITAVKVADPNIPGQMVNKLVWPDGSDVKLTDGYLKGIMDARDSILPTYLNQIDQVAMSLYNGMNSMQAAGYSLNEEESQHQQSHVNEFFTIYPENAGKAFFAMRLSVNKDLTGTVENLNKIAASAIASNTAAGISNYHNGVNAFAMSTMLQSEYIGGQLTLISEPNSRYIQTQYFQGKGDGIVPTVDSTTAGADTAHFSINVSEALYRKTGSVYSPISSVAPSNDITSSFRYYKTNADGTMSLDASRITTATYNYAAGPPEATTVDFAIGGATPSVGDVISFENMDTKAFYDADGNALQPHLFKFNGTTWDVIKPGLSSINIYNANGQQDVTATGGKLSYVNGKLMATINVLGTEKSYEYKFDKGVGFEDFTNKMISMLGVDSGEATKMTDNETLMSKQIDDLRQSVMGVSIDEELTQMIKYQKGYSACARMTTTFDEMLDIIINKLGTVGR